MHFCFEHTVPLPQGSVFAFFRNTQRLELLHAGSPKVRLLHCESQVRVGAELWVEVTVGGFIPIVLGFRHFLFEPPFRFAEETIRGPFSRFTHVHEFEACQGATLVRDVLEVCLPWHYGGHTAMEHGIAPAIRRMFKERAKALTRLAGEGLLLRAVCGAADADER